MSNQTFNFSALTYHSVDYSANPKASEEQGEPMVNLVVYVGGLVRDDPWESLTHVNPVRYADVQQEIKKLKELGSIELMDWDCSVSKATCIKTLYDFYTSKEYRRDRTLKMFRHYATEKDTSLLPMLEMNDEELLQFFVERKTKKEFSDLIRVAKEHLGVD